MFNKVLIFGGFALMAILLVENMVIPSQAFLFIDRGSTTWMLSLVSSIIGAGIGYGICNFMNTDHSENEELDF